MAPATMDWWLAQVVLLALGVQLFCDLQLNAQQVGLKAAAAAKSRAGRDPLTYLPSALPSPARPVGTFITFDVPGAVNGSYPVSINLAGAITGSYADADFLGHGFLRAENGSISTLDVPGAATFGTVPSSINPADTITGSYDDANFVGRGFLRTANGNLVTFDVPGAVRRAFSEEPMQSLQRIFCLRAPSAKATLEPFAFNPGPLGPEEHN